MTAEIFKKQILSVVEVWEDWLVFPADFTRDLRVRLDGEASEQGKSITQHSAEEATPAEAPLASTNKFKASSFKPASATDPQDVPTTSGDVNDIDGDVIDDIDGDPVDADDLDGMPLDGEPLDGELLDGDALDDDVLDGEPLDAEPAQDAPAVRLGKEPINEDSDVPMELDEDSD